MTDNVIKKKAPAAPKKEKAKKEPTAAQMKKFAKKFTPEQWEKLCSTKEFVEVVDRDLVAAQEYADKILEKVLAKPKKKS